MDWLRSEDLKEEKVVTAPSVIVGVLILDNKPRVQYLDRLSQSLADLP